MKEKAAQLSFVALLALLLAPTSVFGQEQVSGTVQDADAQPLPGVNVFVKGSPAQGTASDVNGAFSLSAGILVPGI